MGRVGLAEMSAGQPEGAANHHGERRNHDEPDGELVFAFHSGRPSMNWRTTGSSVCCISSTVPTWRMRPS